MQYRPQGRSSSGMPIGHGYSVGINPNATFLGGSMFGPTNKPKPKKKFRPRVKVIYVKQRPRTRRKVVYY
jgi:hypothetical protein